MGFLQRLEAYTVFMSWKVRTDTLAPDLDSLKEIFAKNTGGHFYCEKLSLQIYER